MPFRERLKRFRKHIISLRNDILLSPANVIINQPPGTVTSAPLAVPLAGNPTAQPSAIGQPTAASTAAGGVEGGATNAWPRLKSFMHMLDQSPVASGPLKVITGGLVECIEIYEQAANNRKEYHKLRIELENIFTNLEQFLVQADSLVFTSSMESLCNSLQKELEHIRAKQNRRAVERSLEARDDSDEILACYQRIHIYLQRLLLNVNLSSWRIVDEQATNATLDRLCSSMSACYNSSQAEELKRGVCTPGTRIEVLGQMHSWVTNPVAGSIYWLNGMAGTGKTTIAYTLCAELDASYKLGASFFCSRSLPECRDVNLIIPSIAYQLAQFSRPFRSELSRVLEKERNVHTRLLQIQFESLIVKPLDAVKGSLPDNLMVVIDALDECDSQESTGRILDALFRMGPDLPIKFFVSSRPEPEIRDQMRKQGNHRESSRMVLHELDKGTVQGDIETYLRQALSPVSPTEMQIETLVQHAGILFIYAATVARYIGFDHFRRNPRSRLETILKVSAAVGNNPYKEIDELYTLIVKAAIEEPGLNDAEREDIKCVLYTAICAREPLTINTLSELLALHNIERVEAALRPLWSVLHVVETSGMVTTLHASFSDYMLDSQRSGKYHCDPVMHHNTLTQCCFDSIKSAKRQFNICGLESSFVLDDMVADLGSRVDKAIPSELYYACRYWASHLRDTQATFETIEGLRDFLSVRLLLWMEIMNLKKCTHACVDVMRQAERWCMVQSLSEETIQLMHDGWRFVAAFISSPVSESTPHIYVSMLPFWPEFSPIFRHYGKRLRAPAVPRGPAIARRRLELLATWPVDGKVSGFACSPDGAEIALAASGKIFLLDGITGRMIMGPLKPGAHVAQSIAYSGHGTRIVSGSFDGTIRVWDAKSGNKIVGPLKGHKKPVNSVAFSPDSIQIVSGSNDRTIRVWDLLSEKTVLGPLTGHSDSVTSVGFSPDSTRLISSSTDGTIRLWDVKSGEAVISLLNEHPQPVTSVAFLLNSTHIVSGSADGTIRTWDMQNGQPMLGPLEGHTRPVNAIGFSPDGTRVVSGSDDMTICVWDIQSGQMVLGPLIGHVSPVTSVGFSPDGTRILSGSSDKTLRVWDVQSTQAKLQVSALHRHTDSVNSVIFTTDGTRIISGSSDNTIGIWDVQSGHTVLGPLQGHIASVTSLGLSSDGTRIVSGCADKTIHVWDIRSGQRVLGPLQGHTQSLNSVMFSPDGTRIVSGSADSTLRVWDVRHGGMVLGPLEGHASDVNSVAFSPNGTLIASGSFDRTIRVWDAQTGLMVGDPLVGHTDSVRSVVFSPDGTRIATGSIDNTVRLWDIQSGQLVLCPLEGHTNWVMSVGFSPDGARIVSGSTDNTIYIWDVESGRIVFGPLKGHTDWVRTVAFSPSGTHIVSGSDDTTIHVWDVRRKPDMMEASDFVLPTPVLWQMSASGWVTDEQSRLLVWVPPDLHYLVLAAHDRIIFNTSQSGYVYLNFDNVWIGPSWTECYQMI